MNKIAIPTDQGMVDSHFGHCAYYTIFTISEDSRVINSERFDSPKGCGCKSNIAPVLAEIGVKTMLAGGIGQGARNVLGNSGISVFSGYSGNVNDAVSDYLKNGYLGENGTCDHVHEDGHSCSH
ncbi:MAG: NifB/NifX family molybdenum-iron cluster-binding protein [Bacteroidales bacterium]|jgi:predicted Fe-Mo cluster-binding NifX family protein|nr:NifB/NifX family molybdenum-iron cluster-binding protein [Bacteroidales bacterium]